MGILKGAQAILDATKPRERKERKNINFFSLVDGESKIVHFLQELDYDSDNYNSEAGVAPLVVEWKSNKDWRKKCVDTSDEGACYPAEVDEKERASGVDWKERSFGRSTRLYINLLAKNDEGEEVVYLWSAPKSVAQFLLEFSNEEGSITDRPFKVTRQGAGSDTRYLLFNKDRDETPVDPTQFELVDPEENLLKVLDYNQQVALFSDDDAGVDGDDAPGDDSGDTDGWI